jgi:hypothetical protein
MHYILSVIINVIHPLYFIRYIKSRYIPSVILNSLHYIRYIVRYISSVMLNPGVFQRKRRKGKRPSRRQTRRRSPPPRQSLRPCPMLKAPQGTRTSRLLQVVYYSFLMCVYYCTIVSLTLIELTLGHLCYRLTDVPPQPNSPPDCFCIYIYIYIYIYETLCICEYKICLCALLI